MLVEKAALGGGGTVSEVGDSDGDEPGEPGAGGEEVDGVGAELGDLGEGDGALGEGDGAGVAEGVGAGGVEVGAGDGVGDAFGDGVGAGGVAVGGVAVGGVAVGGEAFGAAPGAWAMHKVAKRPKIIMNTWNLAKPISIFLC